jgi:hypothetical protein
VGFYEGYAMPKKVEALNAPQVKALREPGKYAVGGADGLALVVQPKTGVRSWVLRVRVDGKSTDRRLGGYSDVPKREGCLTLAEARVAAGALRMQIAAGSDPVAQKRAKKAEAEQAASAARPFREVAEDYIRRHEADTEHWKNAKSAAQWRSSLETYA